MRFWHIETVLNAQRAIRLAPWLATASADCNHLRQFLHRISGPAKKYRHNDGTVFWFRQRKQMRHAYYRNRARQIAPIQDHLFHRIFPVVISLVFTTEPGSGFSDEASRGTYLVATLQRLSKTHVYASSRPNLALIPG